MDRAMWAKIVFAALATYLQHFLGGWDQALQVLVIIIALDYITGVLAAWHAKKLNSYVGLRGIAKKVVMLLLVALAHQVDMLTGTQGVIRLAVIWFMVANEGLSIIENAAETGCPIPNVLRAALEALKERKP